MKVPKFLDTHTTRKWWKRLTHYLDTVHKNDHRRLISSSIDVICATLGVRLLRGKRMGEGATIRSILGVLIGGGVGAAISYLIMHPFDTWGKGKAKQA